MLKPLMITLALALSSMSAHAADVIRVKDLAGRDVEVPAKVEKIILGEGRYVPALAILDRDDPLKRVVGQMGEFKRLDPASYAQYLARFPHLEKVRTIGRDSADSFSIEQAITLKPDLAILGLEGHGPSSSSKEVIAQLEAAGIAIVFIDFRQDPLRNTPRSIELLGKVLGREKEAADYVSFYQEQLALVEERLSKVSSKPRVFLESRVGLSDQCCETMNSGMMGRFIDAAGGDNIAKPLVPGVTGTVNIEYLLTHQPDIYVATAIGSSETMEKMPNRVALGAGVTPELARSSLERAVKRTGIAELDAVRNKNVFAIWHHFYNSPFNVVAVQAMAKWFHPDLFRDIEPVATFETLHKRFQPMPLQGTYWIGLKE